MLPLLQGEHVLWSGKPFDCYLLTGYDYFLIPFSILWGGFALFWNAEVWASDAPIFFRLWGLPFLAVGLYVIFGRFIHDRDVRRKTSYRVTNKRVLIERLGKARRSLDISRLPSLELSERPNGTGTIRFGAQLNVFASNGFGLWSPSFDPTPQFIRIEHARDVYQIIQMQVSG